MKNRTKRSRIISVVAFMIIFSFLLPLHANAATTPEEEVQEVESEEKVPNVPLYFQADYAHINYGAYGTVASHGCGITSVAMVFSYLLDKYITPDTLAKEFGRYNTEHGSSWSLFADSAEEYGLTVTQTSEWADVVEALENGHIVIANPTKCIFTTGGHFIVLYGITEDGKILVHDPNKYNYFMFNEYCHPALTEGFLSGFEQDYFDPACMPCWIYPLKDLEAVEERKLEKALEDYIKEHSNS